MEENKSLQTRSRTINSDEKRMKLNLQKLYVQNFEKEIRCLQKLLKGSEQFSESCIGKSPSKKKPNVFSSKI